MLLQPGHMPKPVPDFFSEVDTWPPCYVKLNVYVSKQRQHSIVTGKYSHHVHASRPVQRYHKHATSLPQSAWHWTFMTCSISELYFYC